MKFLTALLCALALSSSVAAQTRVFYAGDAGSERFHDVHRLSDGSVLVAGQASSLNWIPPSVPRTTLAATGIVSSSPGNIGFVMRVSADLGTVLQVAAFPAGSVRSVQRIRSTEVPGQPTGAIYISGTRDGSSPGYFIARLNNNWIDGAPTAMSWVHNANSGAGSAYQTLQPWDVGSDGEVVFGRGREYAPDWAVMERLGADGVRKTVEHWRAHWFDNPAQAGDQEWSGTPASSYSGAFPLLYSGLVLKAQRRGSLRSTTLADYNLLQQDGNGNGGRKGRYPDDYYFSGPCGLAPGDACPGGPGYTGYRIGQPTQRLGGVVIDRRSNHLYFGYSTQTVLPSGLPDFEPAVVAMRADGSLLWWNRLYRETTSNSTPDQYVDAIEIDYARSELVVLARAHGNNVENLWRGNAIAARPGASGFQNQFTGTNGNIHISWLGKFALEVNELRAATYVGEFVEGSTNYGALFTDPLLAGWPNPNAGWPNLNTTRNCSDLEIAADGSVGIICQGRRSITTSNAFQQMPPPVGAGAALTGTWNYFVRVYTPDLSSLRYSSLLTGAWDTANGQGGDNVTLHGLAFSPGGILVAGTHNACTSVGGLCTQTLVTAAAARPNPLPTIAVPGWGSASPSSQSAVLAKLEAPTLLIGALFVDGFE
ncbi:MAG: hypothetical protein MEQ07_11685 [Aquimonas sp.]|nr:hypothetical protein [Aquimonas sp.]